MKLVNILFFVIIGFVLLLLDYYVFQGIQTLASGGEKTMIQYSYWLISGGLIISVFTILVNFHFLKKTFFAKITFNFFLALLVSKMAFAIVLLGEDIYRTSRTLWLMAFNTLLQKNIDPALIHRNQFISCLAFLFSSVPFLAFIYGVTKGKYNFKVRKQALYFNDLPESFDGFKIVQISDVHAGSLDNPQAVQKGIDLIKAQNADLIVFTGDLVNHWSVEIEPWLDYFNQITAPYGKFSILGNHDYGDYVQWPSAQKKEENLENLKQYHNLLGFKLLLDESTSIIKNGESINLMGVENWGLGFGKRGNLAKALSNVPENAFKILLSHDPSHWDTEVKLQRPKVHLTLSGHTHGMQFGIEIGKFKWSPSKYKYPNWAGLTQENGRFLYVNRGFGFHGFEGRVGIWPEITLIELRKQG
jgi:uncharacterized protein